MTGFAPTFRHSLILAEGPSWVDTGPTRLRTAAGSEPVRGWLKALSSDDKQIIGQDIATVEFGWPIGMPTCRSLTSRWLVTRVTLGAPAERRLLSANAPEPSEALPGAAC